MKKIAARITTAVLVLLLVSSILPVGVYASSLDTIRWIDAQISEPAPFSEGLAAVRRPWDDKEYGFMDKTGKLVISTDYSPRTPGPNETRLFKDGLKAVIDYSNGSKYGFIDKTGKAVIPVIYEDIDILSEGLMRVRKDGKYGFIDKTGKVIIPIVYRNAYSFSEGLAAVHNENGKWGYIDKTGELVIPYRYDMADQFSEGLAKVKVGDLYGFIDKKGNVIIPINLKFAGDFNEGLAEISSNGKYGLMDKYGNIVVKPIYYSVGEFSNGLARVTTSDGKVGYVDKNGKIAIPVMYEAGGFNLGDDFKDGYTRVKYNGKWGMIDTKGNIIIPIIYSDVGRFSEGLAMIREGNKYGFADKTGNAVIPAVYDYVLDFSNGYAAVKIDNRWGFIDKAGKLVVPAIFNEVTSFSDGAAWVNKSIEMRGSRWGIISVTAPSPVAIPTTSKILVNGKSVTFDAYNINGSNYFKLRDLAYVLNGTQKQFEVSYDAEKKAVNMVSYSAYTPVGGEMSKGDGKTKSPTISAARIYKNDLELGIVGYNIAGNNYFKLRDLADEFNFSVDWDAATGTVSIDTGKSYVRP